MLKKLMLRQNLLYFLLNFYFLLLDEFSSFSRHFKLLKLRIYAYPESALMQQNSCIRSYFVFSTDFQQNTSKKLLLP
jgi:hypothetical protein